MTKNERLVIKHELETEYRCMLKNFYLNQNNGQYDRSVTRLVQTEWLAKALCPQNSTIEKYFEWNEETKEAQRRMVDSWWKAKQEAAK